MQVDLIAHTVLAEDYETDGKILDQTEYTRHGAWSGVSHADELAEFAGRSCYTSWKRPNPATATNEGYIANILKQGHFSVLEHASATFYVQGVSRALTHELIRHRHLSYSQLSQRFVNEDREDDLVLPPAARGDEEAERHHEYAHELAHNMYDILVKHYTSKGLPRKQAREAARAVLPNQQETKVVITSNLRGWREFILKRNTEAADAEIRLLAQRVLEHLRSIAPHSVQDLADGPYA